MIGNRNSPIKSGKMSNWLTLNRRVSSLSLSTPKTIGNKITFLKNHLELRQVSLKSEVLYLQFIQYQQKEHPFLASYSWTKTQKKNKSTLNQKQIDRTRRDIWLWRSRSWLQSMHALLNIMSVVKKKGN